ncbi:MAG: hypothetical protein KC657_05485 [Myxococcales bacterium]|nr:hypothetical protein [Myxococcales bacterium]
MVLSPAAVTPVTAALLASMLGAGALACGRDQPEPLRPAPGDAESPVTVHQPPSLTSVETKEIDGLGRPVRVACVTCHSTRDAGGALPTSANELREFHVGLTVRHGTLACASCHAARAGGEPMLHLATGEELRTSETMRLCAQCHGPKLREYEAGRHGGMTGHWDLSQGPRTRNHCVDCHDPHVPAFQPSVPVLRPRDRFLAPPSAAHAGDSHG